MCLHNILFYKKCGISQNNLQPTFCNIGIFFQKFTELHLHLHDHMPIQCSPINKNVKKENFTDVKMTSNATLCQTLDSTYNSVLGADVSSVFIEMATVLITASKYLIISI